MEKSICCFIDILGYKDIICNSSDEENEENIKKLKNIYSEFEKFNNGYQDKYRNYKVKNFSDNIYIEIKLEEDTIGVSNIGDVFNVLRNLCHFQNIMFVEYDFFIRGGIVYGNVYSDENIIYGKGIVEAVESEKKAKFPRIIISKELKEIIDKNKIDLGVEDKTVIKLDNYPEYFLNYLDDMDYQWIEKLLLKHKELIEFNLEKYKNNENVFEKYRWLKEYHNFYIKEYGVPNCYADDESYRDYDIKDLLID